MEAHAETRQGAASPRDARDARRPREPLAARLRVALLGLLPVVLIAVTAAFFAALGAPGLGERVGPPVEELAVERTVLRPGQIELHVRNDGPDAVRVAQVIVNDAYVDFVSSADEIGRLAGATLTIDYPWVEGEAYEIALLTSLGATIDHAVPVAVETPAAGPGFYGLMAIIGTYVGIIPIALGMLWLPWLRRVGRKWMPTIMAFTVGLLVFLAIDATLEGVEVAGAGSQAFGGALLVFLGAITAYVAVAAVDAWLRSSGNAASGAGATGFRLALLIAIGIGLHNLGEGLAIGAAYSLGALALGSLLVIGFAIHNTTEGLAIVAPLSGRMAGAAGPVEATGPAASRPSPARLAGLGLIAGAPAILGAWLGAVAFNASIVSFLLGVGVGAIAQVVVQLAPHMRDQQGRYIHVLSAAGLVAGFAVLYVTALLVSV
jgi:zinc transporter ZupT